MSEPTPEQIKKALKEELRNILSLILCVIIPPIGFVILLIGFLV